MQECKLFRAPSIALNCTTENKEIPKEAFQAKKRSYNQQVDCDPRDPRQEPRIDLYARALLDAVLEQVTSFCRNSWSWRIRREFEPVQVACSGDLFLKIASHRRNRLMSRQECTLHLGWAAKKSWLFNSLRILADVLNHSVQATSDIIWASVWLGKCPFWIVWLYSLHSSCVMFVHVLWLASRSLKSTGVLW